MANSITIRDWTAGDLPKLMEFHAKMGVGYPLPEITPLFCVLKVAIDEDGEIVAFAALKLVAEAFFWFNPGNLQVTNTRALAFISNECRDEADKMGLDEVSCWMPDRIAQFFGKLIERLGWRQSPWRNWTYLIK